MRINLDVPYAQKAAAKRHGAQWDPIKRVWYVVDPKDFRPFVRWIIDHTELQPLSQADRLELKRIDRIADQFAAMRDRKRKELTQQDATRHGGRPIA